MSNESSNTLSSAFVAFKRKANSAGLKLIHQVEGILKKWPDQFCLITGAPRSGTTAMEKWLNSQVNVAAFHETRILIAVHRFFEEASRHKSLIENDEFIGLGKKMAFDFYRKRRVLTGHQLLVDKEPLEPIAFPDKNYAGFLKNYELMFPQGKLLFMIRDPLAAIWSMNERKWGYSLSNYNPHGFSLDEYIQNWCECTDLILQYAGNKNSYVCSFDRLVKQPVAESEKIFEFLQINESIPFQPRPVKTVGFDEDEKIYIKERIKNRLAKLENLGIIDNDVD